MRLGLARRLRMLGMEERAETVGEKMHLSQRKTRNEFGKQLKQEEFISVL